ncbi:putative inorganic phosphate cotransporter [Sitophilus oryzae]|uniref:Putative inorganic phosphate cotransporter n=1 Tax=Sitophilus oryzae TaxID=7048 RepID=A0A6J2XRT1_SITOR|nr:putative inorganic phosphate cotransporter [Sitophilus oryzae]
MQEPPNGFLSTPTFGKRHSQAIILCIMMFLAFAIRVSFSVAIVAMTTPSANRNPNIPTYPEWKDKSVALSAFFWGYIIPQLFAGWIAVQYGPKWFLIGCMAVCGGMCIVLPGMAALVGSMGVMASRAIQGFCQGFIVPCVHCAISRWVPPAERSRLATIVYSAGPLGTVTGMLLTGVISASNLGWPMVFYLFGSASILWAIFSAYFSANSPSTHPNISEGERYFIESSLGQSVDKPKPKTPWKAICTSVPVWAILVGHCGNNWGYWTLMTEIPTYMSKVMNFDIKENSVLSALPYLVMWILNFFIGFASDALINRKVLTVGHARKLFNSIGLLIPALSLFFLGVTPGNEPVRAVTLLVIAVGFGSGVYCGFNVNHVDISPIHAGTLMGITNTIANITGIFAPLMVQIIVTDETDATQWKIIFFITAIINVATGLFSNFFASGEVQKWNDSP